MSFLLATTGRSVAQPWPQLADYTLLAGTGGSGASLTQVGETIVLTGDWPSMAVLTGVDVADVQVTARIIMGGLVGMGTVQTNIGIICRASVNSGKLQGYLGTARWYNSNNTSGMDLSLFRPGDDTLFHQVLDNEVPSDAGASNLYRTQDSWFQMQAEGTAIRFRTVLANAVEPENMPVESSPPANTPTWPAFTIVGTDSTYASGSVGIAGTNHPVNGATITLKHLEWEAL